MRSTVKESMTVAVRAFGWDRAAIATLRHSTLPWVDGVAPEWTIEATPLPAATLGARDRLSLVAQFAAHQALLQFAGIVDGELDAAEWAVAKKRGHDCRLIRIAAKGGVRDAPPALTSIQQCAAAVDAPPLDVLRQSWARAESAYHEAFTRLRSDATADLRWTRRAACGVILSPGIESLRAILEASHGRFGYDDPACIESLRALQSPDVIILGDHASPFGRCSAIPNIGQAFQSASEAEIAERIIAGLGGRRVIFAVTNADAFDAASKQVVRLLATFDGAVWVTPGGDLPRSRTFIVATRLAARRKLESRMTASDAAAFVESEAFPRFLSEGAIPPDDETIALESLREPLRSYIGALALLGRRIPRSIVEPFLRQLLFGGDLDDLGVPGMTAVGGEVIVFVSEAVRLAACRLLPEASRTALCRVAAVVAEERGDLVRAASLRIDAGDEAEAVPLLETSGDVAILRRLSPAALATSPALARRYAESLIDSGRYRDAREIATLAKDELMIARVERRTGDYASALGRLEAMPSRDADAELLRGELLFLEGRYAEAGLAFDICRPASSYQRAVLDNELGREDEGPRLDGYLAARLETYRALRRRDLDAAARFAEESLALARSVPERIDAALDRVFAEFSAGRWIAARAAALDALAIVEETDGDRAAGGLLFLLAYLAADDGQWAHAEQRIARLRHFYTGTNDERRLRELDLLAAHLAFARGRFDEARRAADAVLTAHAAAQIAEAAALIVDEIDWIEHRDAPLRSTGGSGNVELTDRHRVLCARRKLVPLIRPSATFSPLTRGEGEHGLVPPRPAKRGEGPRSGGEGLDPLRPFLRALLAWERDGGAPPVAETDADRLQIFRSALARRLPLAGELASELGIELAARVVPEDDAIRFLRVAATREFPFAAHDFDVAWRYAVCNRLGIWNESGSLPPLGNETLDSIDPRGDWIVVNPNELLFIEGAGAWPAESRDAVAALFRARSELYRLRRVTEQEEASRPAAIPRPLDGVIGDSPAMREVAALVTRVARRDVAVCILGESGTGKELVARAIHRHSTRRQKTFTAVNCAALPENLIESELFGHVRGAFTGADRDRAGLIETSDGGTLFLDEIGEMPLAAQAKLLRFLQEGEFRRVGDTVSRAADVRVVSATNRKLETAIEEGRFREDLWYRIRGVEIVLPPLRDRGSDILLLAAHFLDREREKHRGGATRLSPEVESAFLSYPWPGNVRELQNAIRAAHALAGDGRSIELEHLPERLRSATVSRRAAGSYQDEVARFRRDLIEKSLRQAHGNQNRAAALLKISRQALSYQIRELGILVHQP